MHSLLSCYLEICSNMDGGCVQTAVMQEQATELHGVTASTLMGVYLQKASSTVPKGCEVPQPYSDRKDGQQERISCDTISKAVRNVPSEFTYKK